MTAYELADKLDEIDETYSLDFRIIEAAVNMLREKEERIARLEKVLNKIANDYPELSQDKARWQNLEHIKWAKEVLK